MATRDLVLCIPNIQSKHALSATAMRYSYCGLVTAAQNYHKDLPSKGCVAKIGHSGFVNVFFGFFFESPYLFIGQGIYF